MTTYQIHYFLETCKSMNMSQASEKLNISQQGLSKAIKAMEDEFGVKLFEKNKNRLRLTKYGELARYELLSIDEKVQHLTNTLERLKREESKTVLIGILEGFLIDNAFGLAKHLGIAKLNENVIFQKCTKDMCEGSCPLLDQAVDLCITKSPVNRDIFCICYSTSEPFYAVIPSGNPLAEKELLQISDLKGQYLIILNRQYKFYNNFVRRCESAGFSPRIHHTVSEISAVFLPCIMGEGIGIVPEFAVGNVSLPEIKIVPLSNDVSEEICVLVRKDSVPTIPAQEFLDSLGR